MALTAVMVIVTDFLTGVLTGMVVCGLLFKFADRPPRQEQSRRSLCLPPRGVAIIRGSIAA